MRTTRFMGVVLVVVLIDMASCAPTVWSTPAPDNARGTALPREDSIDLINNGHDRTSSGDHTSRTPLGRMGPTSFRQEQAETSQHNLHAKRWNDQYFDALEAADPKTSEKDQRESWINYCLPPALMLAAVVGNVLFMLAGLGCFTLCRCIARGIASRKRRKLSSVVDGKKEVGSAKTLTDSIELGERKGSVMSEREKDNWEQGLPLWAMD